MSVVPLLGLVPFLRFLLVEGQQGALPRIYLWWTQVRYSRSRTHLLVSCSRALGTWKLRRGSLHSQHRDNQSARQRCTLQARVDQSGRSQALRGGLCRIASASLVSSPEDVPAACVVLALVRIVLVKARETRSRDARTLCSASCMTSGTQSDSCRDVIP